MKNIIFILLFITSTIFSQDYLNMPDDSLVMLAESGDRDAQYNLGLLVEELTLTKNELRLEYIERDKFYWFELAAAQNHSRALTKVGKEYLSNFGHYKTQDLIKASEYFTLAIPEDSEAYLLLSILNYYGLGTVVNKAQSQIYLKESGNDFFRVPTMLYLEKELVQLVREFTKTNDDNALFILGDFYYLGKTGYYVKDYKKAFKIYKQAAELGNSSASYMLGIMLYDGVGVLKDLTQSYYWITKSAESGNLPAIIKAGIMNYFGDGTPIDLVKAYNWFKISAEQNDSLSQYFLGVMYYKAEGIEKDLSQSKYWIQKAFENGSNTAKKFWDNNKLWLVP